MKLDPLMAWRLQRERSSSEDDDLYESSGSEDDRLRHRNMNLFNFEKDINYIHHKNFLGK